MRAGVHRSAEFPRLNPRGLVPVPADEASGATLSETGAILSYLAERSGRLAPDGARAGQPMRGQSEHRLLRPF